MIKFPEPVFQIFNQLKTEALLKSLVTSSSCIKHNQNIPFHKAQNLHQISTVTTW